MAALRGNLLLPDADEPTRGTVRWERGSIVEISDAVGGDVLDVGDAIVAPGMVDIHGDAFERAVMPRGGVGIDLDLALADNDVQLLAAGITTAYLSITDSWEPGLRSRQMLHDLIAAVGRRTRSAPRLAIHVRHERPNTTDLDDLLAWISDETVTMLSYNDHLRARVTPSQLARSGVDAEAFEELVETARREQPVGEGQERVLAAAAAAVGCVSASHDASTGEHLARDLDLGVAIAEFPMSIDLAQRYRAEGISVLLGAPNLVRGGSHLGNLSVRDAWAAGAADLLCSDYHYPSMLAAPFCLVDAGLASLGAAWRAVSEGPARAAGHPDRGRIAVGAPADLIVIEPPDSSRSVPPRVKQAYVGGALAFVGP